MYDMTHSYVWHDSFIDMTHSYVRHDAFMCDMTHSYARHDAFICVTWLIHMCDMIHWHVQNDAFTCVTWLIHMCDMTHRFKGVVFDDCTAAAGLTAQVKFLKSRSILNLLFQMTIKLTFEKFSLYDSSKTDSTGQISQKASFTVISHSKLITIRLFKSWSYFSKVCLLLNGLREMTLDVKWL